jgi:hypothetical protein
VLADRRGASAGAEAGPRRESRAGEEGVSGGEREMGRERSGQMPRWTGAGP